MRWPRVDLRGTRISYCLDATPFCTGRSLEIVGYDCSCRRRISHWNHDDDSHYVKHCGEEHGLNLGVLMIQNINEYCIETAECIGSRSPQSHGQTNNVSWCSHVVS